MQNYNVHVKNKVMYLYLVNVPKEHYSSACMLCPSKIIEEPFNNVDSDIVLRLH